MAIIVFDMDGVLIDSEPVYLERGMKFLNDKGYPCDFDFLKQMVGSSSNRDFALLQEKFPDFYPSKQAYHQAMNEYFRNNPMDYAKILNPHVVETIQALKERGHSISIASSSPRHNIEHIIEVAGIRQWIDVVATGEDFKESKPNPAIYNYVISQYNADPKDCYAIEDSELGIQAGKAAHMTVIAKRETRFGFHQDKADYIIDDLIEILDIVK